MVFLHFLSIKRCHSSEIKSVANQHSLYLFVKGTWTTQTWRYIYLEQPRLELRIQKDIKPIYLKANLTMLSASNHLVYYVWLHRNECFYDHIFDSILNLRKVDPKFFKLRFKLKQVPFARSLSFILLFLMFLILIFNVPLSLLVDWVICEMNKPFLQALKICRILFCCKSY